MSITFPARTRAIAAAAALLLSPLAAHAQDTYIALGDSYAYGYTNDTAPATDGIQGYAAIYRNILDARNGAAGVNLINLAVSGETSTTFFSGPSVLVPNADPNLVIRDGILRNPARNTNYDATPTTFQSQKFADQVAALAGVGDEVDYLTLQLGGNDILNLFIQPGFNALAAPDQFALLYNRLETLDANLTQALTNINAAAPNADVALIGYADPFPGLGPFNPFPTLDFNPFGPLARVTISAPTSLSTILTLEANVRIAEVAGEQGVRYVDIYTPFLGNETTYTQILTEDPPGTGLPNFHPTPQGYQVIASAIAAPEPGSVALVLIGALPLVGAIVRRRR